MLLTFGCWPFVWQGGKLSNSCYVKQQPRCTSTLSSCNCGLPPLNSGAILEMAHAPLGPLGSWMKQGEFSVNMALDLSKQEK